MQIEKKLKEKINKKIKKKKKINNQNKPKKA